MHLSRAVTWSTKKTGTKDRTQQSDFSVLLHQRHLTRSCPGFSWEAGTAASPCTEHRWQHKGQGAGCLSVIMKGVFTSPTPWKDLGDLRGLRSILPRTAEPQKLKIFNLIMVPKSSGKALVSPSLLTWVDHALPAHRPSFLSAQLSEKIKIPRGDLPGHSSTRSTCILLFKEETLSPPKADPPCCPHLAQSFLSPCSHSSYVVTHDLNWRPLCHVEVLNSATFSQGIICVHLLYRLRESSSLPHCPAKILVQFLTHLTLHLPSLFQDFKCHLLKNS